MTRRISFLTLLLVVLVLLPVAAHADFLYVFQDLDQSVSFSFVQPTLESAGSVTSFLTATLPDPNAILTVFVWDSADTGLCFEIGIPGFGCAGYRAEAGGTNPEFRFAFPVDSFLSAGTFTSTDGFAILTVTETTTPIPEPASLFLVGSGIAGLFAARRKKWLNR